MKENIRGCLRLEKGVLWCFFLLAAVCVLCSYLCMQIVPDPGLAGIANWMII